MIVLPFPSSLLAGHAKGKSFWRKAEVTAQHRGWAKEATEAAKITVPPGKGDIRVHIMFYPANRRGDRINFPNRMKPYFDGIADALKVNDSRFLPVYQFAEPVEDARVVVTIGNHNFEESRENALGQPPVIHKGRDIAFPESGGA